MCIYLYTYNIHIYIRTYVHIRTNRILDFRVTHFCSLTLSGRLPDYFVRHYKDGDELSQVQQKILDKLVEVAGCSPDDYRGRGSTASGRDYRWSDIYEDIDIHLSRNNNETNNELSEFNHAFDILVKQLSSSP